MPRPALATAAHFEAIDLGSGERECIVRPYLAIVHCVESLELHHDRVSRPGEDASNAIFQRVALRCDFDARAGDHGLCVQRVAAEREHEEDYRYVTHMSSRGGTA